jgi:hypothetical protein
VGQSSLLLHLDPARGWAMITRDTIAETIVLYKLAFMNRLADAIVWLECNMLSRSSVRTLWRRASPKPFEGFRPRSN